MIQRQLKLKITKAQDKILTEWIWYLTGAWNTAVRRIELDAKNGIYHSKFDFQNQVAGHSKRMGIPSHVLVAIFTTAHGAWTKCFQKTSGKPRLKSERRPLKSIPFPDPVRPPTGKFITLPILGKLRFIKQDLPKGKIKCARLVKRASGWHLCLFIDTSRAPVVRKTSGSVGIDPGFKSLLTLSTGEKISHPRELGVGAKRLAQAQRGKNKKLTARLHERIANRKKDRNHKISLRLVQDFSFIAFSKDNIKGIARKFGKSVSSSNHCQLREMLKYKSLAGGTEYIEVDCKFSTQTCNSCGGRTGPRGLSGLSVRSWVCKSCGTQHDRDINAAINTLKIGSGRDHERIATLDSGSSEIHGSIGFCGTSTVTGHI